VFFFAFIVVLIEAIVAISAAVHHRYSLSGFLIPLIVYCVAAAFAVVIPRTWVAGGDGWLMLVRGRTPLRWVLTSRLAHVAVHNQGDGDYQPYLTLRDDEGRELEVWLSKLTGEAAAALLAGIAESAEAGLADLSSDGVRAALTAVAEQAARPATSRAAEPG
jgi:hypothetical protein